MKTKYFLSETKRFTKLEPIKPAPPINNIFIKLFFLDAHNPYEDIVACIYYIHINKALNLVSVYAKTNQTESPFITSITLCENNEDIAKEAKFQKAIVLQNGVQTIESGVNDIWGTVINQAGKEWKKYAVTVDIPTNVLVKFVFKLCAGANNQLTGYNATATDNVIYWFDDVSLKLVTE